MMDFASVAVLPYDFATTLDPNNFGTGKIIRAVNSDHFIFNAPSREAMKSSKILFDIHLTAGICQSGLGRINTVVILNI